MAAIGGHKPKLIVTEETRVTPLIRVGTLILATERFHDQADQTIHCSRGLWFV